MRQRTMYLAFFNSDQGEIGRQRITLRSLNLSDCLGVIYTRGFRGRGEVVFSSSVRFRRLIGLR